MIEFSYFKYSEPDWNKIKGVVHKALRRDADEIVLESARMDGTKHDVTLRAKLGEPCLSTSRGIRRCARCQPSWSSGSI